MLLEKDADTPLPPASMSKLMTVLMVFERLKAGVLSMDQTFPVSHKAWKMGGSKTFVRVNRRVSVADLLRGVIVQSGNDASIVIAEGISGSEGSVRRSHDGARAGTGPYEREFHECDRLAASAT